MYCDNWETEFPEATFDTKLMQRSGVGITTRDPMKDLMDAYAKLQYDDEDDADAESESTFVSQHQDKLHVIPGLDDYIMDCSGTVTHLGTHKRIHDTGDWMDDVKLPTKSLSSLQRRPFKHHLDTIDDLEIEQEENHDPPSTPAPSDEPIVPRTPPWMPSSCDPNRRSESQKPTDEHPPPRYPQPWPPYTDGVPLGRARMDQPMDEPYVPPTPPWMPSRGDPNRRADSQKPADEHPPPRYPQPWPPYTDGVPPGRAREPYAPPRPPWMPSRGDPNRRANMERSLTQAPPLKPVRLIEPMDEAPQSRRVQFGDMNEQKTFIPDDNDEEDDDNFDDNFDDIHLPDNMATLQLKPNSRVPSPTPPPPPAMKPTTIRKPYQETDEDEDFFNGVHIDGDDALRYPTLKHLIKKQPTTPSPNKTSMIPRRVVTPQSNNNTKQPCRLQRPAVATQPQPVAKKHIHLQGTAGSRPGMLTTPRTRKNYGDGTELDDLDIIPQWRRHSLSFWKKENRLQGGVDPKRPWRHNMTRRRPTLIKLDEHPVKQGIVYSLPNLCKLHLTSFSIEYNEMKYDPVRHCWQGNENSMLSFGDASTTKSYRRPTLISNMGHKSKQQAKPTGVVVGSMMFDPVKMCWKKMDTNDEEDKIFDRIEDLDATEAGHPQKGVASGSELGAKAYASLGNNAPEFDLSRHVQHQMHQEEETHCEQMDAWLHGDTTKQERLKHAHMLYNM
ncbi:predicted protein [Lichtheimia corymbifera JMRC:FSU:9682]|uniref:Uncharacterized protein n=1 Tax=Lichtheimia corymbifera JMRC:FSU:9682 TaxID=1263082 RepID=A0A068RUM7_9FUNG|nr:predicted protein [Lichtheimia corymbifera JMRC:FSU:9682]